MAKPFRVDELLKDQPEDREAFEAFARVPARTVDECQQWLEARGYVVHRSTVGTWKKEFTARCMAERLAGSSGLAAALKTAVTGDFDDVSASAKMVLTNVVLEQVTQLQAEGQLDPLDVQRWTRSLANLVGTEEKQRKLLAEQRAEYEAKQAAAVAAAEAEAKGGAGGEAVVSVIKKAFGL
jgi:hypothetical protein